MQYRMTFFGISTGLGSLVNRGYAYDAADSLEPGTNNLVPKRRLGFEYDDLSRLETSTRPPASTKTYQYDSIGNRTYLIELENGQQNRLIEYVYAGTGTSPKLQEVRITPAGQPQEAHPVLYDQRGNVTDDSSSAYTYNLLNKMVLQSTAAPEEEARISFQYDSGGRRVLTRSEVANGWSVDHYLLSDGRPFVEVALDGGLNEVEERLFIHLGQRLVATISGGSVGHVISDHIGFPLAVADEQGSILWCASHQPFGDVDTIHEGNVDADPLRRYPGQWKPDPSLFSAPTKLLYNGNRWYRPEWGKYTQADPLTPLFGYGYAAANPLNLVDPLGLKCSPWRKTLKPEHMQTKDEHYGHQDFWEVLALPVPAGGKRVPVFAGVLCCRAEYFEHNSYGKDRERRYCDCNEPVSTDAYKAQEYTGHPPWRKAWEHLVKSPCCVRREYRFIDRHDPYVYDTFYVYDLFCTWRLWASQCETVFQQWPAEPVYPK